jgi:cytochrome c oxidase subunit 2
MRGGAIFRLLLFALVATAGGLTLALAPGWLPQPATREAGRIHFVFWFTIGICVFIFAIVAAVLSYAVLKFRVKPDDDSDGPPVHGHTGLEIAWTALPTVLVIAIGIVSAIVLAKDDARGKNVLNVTVVGQQFAWSFQYPEYKNLTSGTLHLPVGRSVVLHMKALDVLHSFWVPEFSQKQDLVPGISPTLHITPTRKGTFDVVCTELCGLGHALMRTQAIVESPSAFQAWATKQGNAAASGSPSKAGAAVFKNNGCGACHTFAPANAAGKVGPDLDTRLAADAKRANKSLADFTRESIVNPNAYVAPGYHKNIMPPTYGSSLPKDQLDALVQYLDANQKGK